MTTNFFNDPSKYKLPDVSAERHSSNDIEIYGLYDKKRVIRYVPEDYPIPKIKVPIEKYKLFVPKAYGSGKFGESPSDFIIGRPGQICTETFLAFGPFETEYEVESFKKYYYTKFFRSLLGILKTTQDNVTVYDYIPIQDFTEKSDINWSNSISDIDKQLYEKYSLNEDEILFLEEKIEDKRLNK